ncbi:MAG TPA: WhiB family transcriptional regulator [Acidimicrobiales bacterium]|nr:WhiB family transcriptional regulator [Acidimicrobiales bacterium]
MNKIWMEQSACTDFSSDVFFPSDGMGVINAKSICENCSVSKSCLEYALHNHIDHGVWGGCSERQRRRILKARRIDR